MQIDSINLAMTINKKDTAVNTTPFVLSILLYITLFYESSYNHVVKDFFDILHEYTP